MLKRASRMDWTGLIRRANAEIEKSRQIGGLFAPDQESDGRSMAACMSRGPSGSRNRRGRRFCSRKSLLSFLVGKRGSRGASVRLTHGPGHDFECANGVHELHLGDFVAKSAGSPFRHSPLKPEPAGTASTPALDSSAQDRLNQMRPRLPHHLREQGV